MDYNKYFDLSVFLNKDGFDEMRMEEVERLEEYILGLLDWVQSEKRRKAVLQRLISEL